MEGGHHHHHHQQQQHQHLLQQILLPHHHQQQQHNTIISVDGGGGGGISDRFPQWSIQETKEFLMIRGELDQTFMETKRNKQLWEVISNNMKEKGYHRSAEQCKCKWKNLVTRYKGCETMEPEALRQQFPFYNEIQAIFTSRSMQRMLWAEAEGTSKKNKSMQHHQQQLSSEEEEDEDDNGNNNNEESEEHHHQKGSSINTTRRKKKKAKISGKYNNNGDFLNNLKEILEEFMRQQMQMEAQWMEAFESREKERRMKEMEWRQTMEALENERIMMDQRWREREEQWRLREEVRAQNRDELITTLLHKLQ
ncbi:Trihelix transcription factor GT-3b [Stylosanthes scabra]|uniref:Trihelix transcription factor GT-3b n=1 Tax=Stylosanthes scabra TaxID=79078 RepID=A0ABU6RU42_9FABA|nr:Trihelix transcription factor GT-3b [Stylosanthes scabra]